MEVKRVVTRPHDAVRITDSTAQPVDVRASKVVPSSHPFFQLVPEMKPADAAHAAWEAYKAQPSRTKGYVHCIRLDTTDQLVTASLQMFTDDIRLGNLKIEGFLRPLIDPALTEAQNIKNLQEGLRELRRYERSGVLRINGFFTSREDSQA